jgi:hypothetical protein
VFLTLGKHLDGPLVLEAQQTTSSLKILGRGYKPDEPLSLWSNYADGSTVAIPGVFHAQDDQDGTLALNFPALPASVTSVVVYGRSSLVTGVLELRSTKAAATNKGSARQRSRAATARPVR